MTTQTKKTTTRKTTVKTRVKLPPNPFVHEILDLVDSQRTKAKKIQILQEYSDESDVAEFCSTEYGVDFPMFSTVKVRGKKAHPFYKKLTAETGYTPSWNFNKYLISKEGKVVSTYGSKVKPDSQELISAIEGLL